MDKGILKIILIISIIIGGYFYFNPSPKVTLNPTEDARTCMKLYERNSQKAQDYIEVATVAYYQEGKHTQLDKFLDIITKEMARKDFNN